MNADSATFSDSLFPSDVGLGEGEGDLRPLPLSPLLSFSLASVCVGGGGGGGGRRGHVCV